MRKSKMCTKRTFLCNSKTMQINQDHNLKSKKITPKNARPRTHTTTVYVKLTWSDM